MAGKSWPFHPNVFGASQNNQALLVVQNRIPLDWTTRWLKLLQSL